MKNSKVVKIFLVLSGLLLTVIGGATLFMPVEMKANEGIDISGNVNVLNDLRASAALILTLALFTISGAFVKRITYAASLVSALLFLSLGVGRLISILVDGMPVDGMVKATGLEFILGTVGIILFAIYREKK